MLQSDLNELRQQVQSLTLSLEREQREREYYVEDKVRAHRLELDELRRELNDETERQQRAHREALEALERHYRAEMEDVQDHKCKEIQELRLKLGSEQQDLELTLQGKDREIQSMRAQLEDLRGDLDGEKAMRGKLQKSLAESSTTNTALEDRARALRAQIEFLESDSKQQSDQFADMEANWSDCCRS